MYWGPNTFTEMRVANMDGGTNPISDMAVTNMDANAGPVVVNQQSLIAALTTEVIEPGYAQFAVAAENLAAAMVAWASEVSEDNYAAAQTAWR